MAPGIPMYCHAADIPSSLPVEHLSVYCDTVPVGTTSVMKSRKAEAWCLKTNLLYDAIGLPGIGAEVLLRHFSIGINYHYGWWRKNSAHREYKGFLTELHGRYWFDKSYSLKGHHIGVYGDLFSYDYEKNGVGKMCGKPGDNLWETTHWATGLEYGYCWKLSDRISLDFCVGVGYTTGICHKYKAIDKHHVWMSTYRRHFFGPTKAELSFVWVFDRKNRNVSNCRSRKGDAK